MVEVKEVIKCPKCGKNAEFISYDVDGGKITLRYYCNHCKKQIFKKAPKGTTPMMLLQSMFR